MGKSILWIAFVTVVGQVFPQINMMVYVVGLLLPSIYYLGRAFIWDPWQARRQARRAESHPTTF